MGGVDTDPIGRHEARQPPIDLFDDYRGRHIRQARHRAPEAARPARRGTLAATVAAFLGASVALAAVDGALLTDPAHDAPAAAPPFTWPGEGRLFGDTPAAPVRPDASAPLTVAVPVALVMPTPEVKAKPAPVVAVHAVRLPARQAVRQAIPEPRRTEAATTRAAPADDPVCAPEPVAETPTAEPVEPTPEATPEPSPTPEAEPPADPPRNPRADEVANGPKPTLPLDGTSPGETLPTNPHQRAEAGNVQR